MARELGERVKLESPVYSVDQTGDVVLVKTLGDQTYSVSLSGGRGGGSPDLENPGGDAAASHRVSTQSN